MKFVAHIGWKRYAYHPLERCGDCLVSLLPPPPEIKRKSCESDSSPIRNGSPPRLLRVWSGQREQVCEDIANSFACCRPKALRSMVSIFLKSNQASKTPSVAVSLKAADSFLRRRCTNAWCGREMETSHAAAVRDAEDRPWRIRTGRLLARRGLVAVQRHAAAQCVARTLRPIFYTPNSPAAKALSCLPSGVFSSSEPEGDRSPIGRTAELRRIPYICVIIMHGYSKPKFYQRSDPTVLSGFSVWHGTCCSCL